MFYRADANDHGLPHNPFKAIVSPRPIGWISTLCADGSANLAPYSFFNGVNDDPPMVMFASQTVKFGTDGPKDSATNARAQGEFTVNVVGAELTQAMNVSSAHFEHGVDEFARAGLEKAPGVTVACPFVADAPAALECKTYKIIDLPGGRYEMVIGTVTGIHIRDDMIRDGRYDVTLARHLSRLGYRDYAQIETVFELTRPDD